MKIVGLVRSDLGSAPLPLEAVAMLLESYGACQDFAFPQVMFDGLTASTRHRKGRLQIYVYFLGPEIPEDARTCQVQSWIMPVDATGVQKPVQLRPTLSKSCLRNRAGNSSAM